MDNIIVFLFRFLCGLGRGGGGIGAGGELTSPAGSRLHSGTLHSQEGAIVWKGMETACRLALIYSLSPPAKSNKSQHYGPLTRESSSAPKKLERRREGRGSGSLIQNDTVVLAELEPSVQSYLSPLAEEMSLKPSCRENTGAKAQCVEFATSLFGCNEETTRRGTETKSVHKHLSLITP